MAEAAPKIRHNAESAVSPNSDTTAKTTPFTATIRSFFPPHCSVERSPGRCQAEKGIPMSFHANAGAAAVKGCPAGEKPDGRRTGREGAKETVAQTTAKMNIFRARAAAMCFRCRPAAA